MRSVTVEVFGGPVTIDLTVPECPVCGTMLRETDDGLLICPWNPCYHRSDYGYRYTEEN